MSLVMEILVGQLDLLHLGLEYMNTHTLNTKKRLYRQYPEAIRTPPKYGHFLKKKNYNIIYTLYKIVALTVLIVAYTHSAFIFKWHSKKSSGVHNKKQRENGKICRENEKTACFQFVFYAETFFIFTFPVKLFCFEITFELN